MMVAPTQARVLTTFEEAEGVPMGILPALFSAARPDDPAVICDDESISWRKFEERSNQLARALAARGVGQDDVVAAQLPNRPEAYLLSFAAWKLGATPAFISFRMPDAELRVLLDVLAPRIMLVDRHSGIANAFGFEDLLAEAATCDTAALPPRIAKSWKVGCTGGSTGQPRALFHPLPSRWDPTRAILGIAPGDRVLMPGPLHHTGPFNMSHYALMNGCTVVLMRRFDPAELLRLIEVHRITFVFLVPTMMRRIWMLDPAVREASDVSSLQMLSHAAAPCPVWLKERFIDWFGPEKIAESYGGAEEYGATLINGIEWLERRGSVGRAVPGYEAFILDEQGNPLPEGEIGMLWFSGPRGRNSFGDMAAIDKDGYVYLADRRTDLIISSGVNIYPAEVEAAIERHDSVVSAAVIGLPDEDLGKAAHAIVQLAENAPELDARELEAFVAPLITHSKIPRTWEFTREMLRDEAGKVRRGGLLAAHLAARAAQGS